jgi:taurine transport system permease protein
MGVFDRFGSGSSDQRKTVTFGDASAVRSKPFWSLVSLLLLVVFWWVATTPFGFPEEFKASVDQQFAEAADAQEAKNEERIANGNPNLVAVPSRQPLQRDYLTVCTTGEDNGCSADDYSQWLNPRTLPSPGDTWTQFNRLRTTGFQGTTLWEHARISLWRVVRGMFWGVLIGVPVGMAMGLSSRLRGFFDTPVEGFRTIPPLAILPLFILWFGIGDGTAVRILIFASVWIMIIAARAGAGTVKLSKVRAAYSLGASKSQVLCRVILPNALPELFTGMRVALGVSWGTLVAAELVGAESGLGAMIFLARSFLRTDVVVVGIIVIAVIGVMMDIVMRWLESKLIPWRGKG